MNIQKPEVPLNPLVTSLKMKHGVKEKITPNSSGELDLLILVLIYSIEEDNHYTGILDRKPIILVLAVVEDGKVYKLYKGLKFENSKTNGIYGLNLDLLLSDNKHNLEILQKKKVKILNLYQKYIIPGTKQEIKDELINLIKEEIDFFYHLNTFKGLQKVFIQNPFYLYKTGCIKYSQSIKDDKIINSIKLFQPKTFETKATENVISKGKSKPDVMKKKT